MRFFESRFFASVPIPDLKEGRHRATLSARCPILRPGHRYRRAASKLWQALRRSASLPNCFSDFSPLFSCGFELAIPFGKDPLIPTGKLVRWSHVTQRTVKPNLVVLSDAVLNQPLGIFQR
jgi:hypothetical protein